MTIQRPRRSVSEREVTLDAQKLAQGVSRQPPHQRFPGQVEDAVNVSLDIAAGIRKRPGTHFDRKITITHGIALEKGGDYRLHPIVRNEDEQYLVLYGETEVKVFDLVNGDQATVTAINGGTYLDLNEPSADDMRLITVEDTTLILNTTVPAVTRKTAAFTLAAGWRDYGVMLAQTPADATYHRAMHDQAGGEESGYFKYDVGGATFPTAVFPEVTGDNATPYGIYTDATTSVGFVVRFQRLSLAITGGAFNTAARTLTKTGAFASYVWTDGDAIKITGGSGVAVGWYKVKSKTSSDVIVLEQDIGGVNPADVTASSLALQCEVAYDHDATPLLDMHDVAAKWTDAFRRVGAANALVSWRTTRAGYGAFTITGPYRGSVATILDLEAPTAGQDAGASNAYPFYRTGVTITAGTGSAGVGTDTPDTLAPEDRWTRVAAPDDFTAALDERTMPLRLFRTALGPGAKFSLDYVDWNDRLSGDEVTNPAPSLWDKASAHGTITANTLANPTVIASTAHGRSTGQTVSIIGSNSTPSIDGTHVITVIDVDHFSVPVNVSVAGTSGTWFYGAKPITAMVVHDNRLFLGGSGNVVASQAGDLFNFWIDDYRNIVDSDPLDMLVGSGGGNIADWLAEFRQTIVVFTRDRQYEPTADALTPATAGLKPTTTIRIDEPTAGLRPQPSTHDLHFTGPTTRSVALWAYGYDDILQAQSPDEVSQHVQDYLPLAARSIVTAPNEGITFLLEENNNGLWVYRTVRKGNQTQQAAWCRWEFDPVYRIVDIAVVGTNLWMLVEQAPAVTIAPGSPDPTVDDAVVTFNGHGFSDGDVILLIDSDTNPSVDGFHTVANKTANTFELSGVQIDAGGGARCARGVYILEYVTLSREATIPQDGYLPAWPYAIHLDRQIYATGSYNAGTDITTWTVPTGFFGDGSTLNRVVLGPAFGDDAGTVLTLTEYGATTVGIEGDYSDGEVCLGRFYEMEVTLSQPFMRDEQGNADLKSSFLHRELVATHYQTGDYQINATFSGGGAPDPSETTFTPLPDAQIAVKGELHAWIGGPVENMEIALFSDSPRPVTIGAIQHIGDYSPV